MSTELAGFLVHPSRGLVDGGAVSGGDYEPNDISGDVLAGGCSCSTTTLPSSAGEMVVVRVTGEVDYFSVPIVAAALSAAVERRPSNLVVDLAGMSFCSARGLVLLVESGRSAADNGIGYVVSGASCHVSRMWALLWRENELPLRHPNTAAAMAGQVDRVTRPF